MEGNETDVPRPAIEEYAGELESAVEGNVDPVPGSGLGVVLQAIDEELVKEAEAIREHLDALRRYQRWRQLRTMLHAASERSLDAVVRHGAVEELKAATDAESEAFDELQRRGRDARPHLERIRPG